MVLATLCFLAFFVTIIMFVVYWWKKRKVRIAAGENYQNDERYQSVSKQKTLIGWISFLLFMGMIVAPKISESLMTYKAQQEQERIESQSRAEEKAKTEAEEQKLRAEKKAQEEAEQKRLAEEKSQREAEEKRLAEEKKAQEEAEQKRLAEEKSQREAEEKHIAEERRKNPYYDYRNNDKSLIGYQFYYSIAKTPKIKQFLEEREDLPNEGFISENELQGLEYRKVSFTRNTLYPDRYEMDEHGDILYNGHTSLEIPIVSKIKGELTPAYKGIFAKRLPSGEIVPVYIGYLGQGTFEEYGILFETVLKDHKYFTYIKYEGGFKNHKFDGEGNLYEIDSSTLNDELPKIKVSSGHFSEGKKVGGFVEYINGEEVYKQY